ncbi:small-subunit processome, Utp14 [Kipferlia bialata]|uniref:Small-subunit processome, Utp14 n=1 Tax=Kipferlia bialata TaxID=797122 RepID=A0A9K3CVZ3_9EUKA|nr:small-subunit processome, Utp14 [Kipferlia bialata]GIQ83505.1 small-subunit processome, Utp14 [Kipferlia bialata]GIQ85972.1 small-subunit processome, Utp14 [Kipferlia bialata]|eukprot:g4409.t1
MDSAGDDAPLFGGQGATGGYDSAVTSLDDLMAAVGGVVSEDVARQSDKVAETIQAPRPVVSGPAARRARQAATREKADRDVSRWAGYVHTNDMKKNHVYGDSTAKAGHSLAFATQMRTETSLQSEIAAVLAGAGLVQNGRPQLTEEESKVGVTGLVVVISSVITLLFDPVSLSATSLYI